MLANDTHANNALLADFHNIHVGRRCFVMGNGPSLLTQDLTPLNNEITFCCNGIGEWGDIPFTPTYYGVSDINREDWLERNAQKTERFGCPRFNVQFPWWPSHDAYYNVEKAHDSHQTISEGFMGFDDELGAIPTARSTPLTLAQIALWMGIREFYFLGYENTRGYAWEPDRVISTTGRAQFNIDKNFRYSLAIQNSGKRFRADLEAHGGSVTDCTPESFLAGLGQPRRSINHGLQIWDYKPLEEVLS